MRAWEAEKARAAPVAGRTADLSSQTWLQASLLPDVHHYHLRQGGGLTGEGLPRRLAGVNRSPLHVLG